MMKLAIVAFLVAINFAASEAGCSSNSPIDRVYVYRRPLSALKQLGSTCAIAHSGLILKLKDGHECVLEYMGDGKAHLYNANYRTTFSLWGAYKIRFTDYLGDTYSTGTTRQRYGAKVNRYATPVGAYQTMARLMSKPYDLLKHNCHMGQEATRKALGLTVQNPYKDPFSNSNELCRCVRRVPKYLLTTVATNPSIALLVSMCY